MELSPTPSLGNSLDDGINVTSFSSIAYWRISEIAISFKNVTHIQSSYEDIFVITYSFQIFLFHFSASQVETK